jgi:uncharacterized protein YbjQ (UPF0145 family)
MRLDERSSCTHLRSISGSSGVLICVDCGTALDGVTERSVAERSAIVEGMPCTTLPSVPGYVIVKQLGIVSAQVVQGMGFGSDILAGLSNTFGGRAEAFEEGIKNARDEVLYALKWEAHSRGANGLAGAAFDQHLLGSASGSASMILVTGTATTVVLAPADSSQSPSESKNQI